MILTSAPTATSPSAFWYLPIDAAAHGPALDRHLLLNLWIALALLTLAHLILFTGLILRRQSEPTRIARVEYLPLAVITILFITLAVKAETLWAANRYTGPSRTALQIEVTGVQFAWYFRYPGPDATFGATRPQLVSAAEANPLGIDPADPHSTDDRVTSKLVLPANREIDLTLRSQDVIHGLTIPEFRLKQNAIPGQTVHLHFTPTAPGTYALLCTQLCGLGHFRMNATVQVVPWGDYIGWLASQPTEAHQ